MRLSPVLASIALAAGVLTPAVWVAPPAHAGSVSAVASTEPTARVIVKFKASSALLRAQPQSATAATTSAVLGTRVQALGSRIGMALGSGIAVSAQSQVVTAGSITSAQLAARLAQESDVEFAVPDERRHAVSVPTDPYYTTGPLDLGTSGGPLSGQWYLHAPSATVQSSINIESAWDVVNGLSPVVVAVLDSGVRFDHVDLGGGSATSPGGNLLPGYDFVSNSVYNNDGDGRDADPSDPGDYITETEANTSDYTKYDCTPKDPNTGKYVAVNSEWHGTQTTGLIAAVTNNGIGIAGAGHNQVQVTPVRVLAKCGGQDSDIQAAMLWAAGIAVPGVPTNPHPARVISLSLGGGTGACPSSYVDVVSQVRAKGVLIVAAAGNGDATTGVGGPVITPANCAGVVAVASTRHAGSKVDFSNLGSEVTITAPGGNCVNTGSGQACVYPIMSTTNTGTTVPVAGGSAYTDSYATKALGTSFSTPLVAATAALVMAANPALSADDVLATIKRTARPFVTSGGSPNISQCVDPEVTGTAVSECYCTTATCGAGMLDASAAVFAAVNGIQAHVTESATSITAGQSLTFDAGTSVLASGHAIASYAWSLTSGSDIAAFTSGTNASTATVSTSAGGSFTVTLTLTDNTGATSTASTTVQVGAIVPLPTPTPTPTPSTSSGGGGAVDWLLPALLPYGVAIALRARRRRHQRFMGRRAGDDSA